MDVRKSVALPPGLRWLLHKRLVGLLKKVVRPHQQLNHQPNHPRKRSVPCHLKLGPRLLRLSVRGGPKQKIIIMHLEISESTLINGSQIQIEALVIHDRLKQRNML